MCVFDYIIDSLVDNVRTLHVVMGELIKNKLGERTSGVLSLKFQASL